MWLMTHTTHTANLWALSLPLQGIVPLHTVETLHTRYCCLCKHQFATKYTFNWHMSTKLAFYDKSLESNGSEYSDEYKDLESGNSDDEETEEDDFWSLLIQETASRMHNERMETDLPDPYEAIHDVSQLATGKNLSTVMNHLKNRYLDIKEISEEADSDMLLDLIENKAANIREQYEEADEDVTKEVEDIAWKKYKFLVR